jgi:hypothetical protein
LVSFQERWLTLCSPWAPFYCSPKRSAAFLTVSISSQICSDFRGIGYFTNRLVGWKRAVKYPLVRKDGAFLNAQYCHFVRSFELWSLENTPTSYIFPFLLSIKTQHEGGAKLWGEQQDKILRWVVTITMVGINFLPEIILICFFIGNRFKTSNVWIKCLCHAPFGLYQLITQFKDQKPNFGAGPKIFYAVHLLLLI